MLLLSDLSGGWKAGAIDLGLISIAQPGDTQHFSERRLHFHFSVQAWKLRGGIRVPASAHSDTSTAIKFMHENIYQFYIRVLRDNAICCLCDTWKFWSRNQSLPLCWSRPHYDHYTCCTSVCTYVFITKHHWAKDLRILILQYEDIQAHYFAFFICMMGIQMNIWDVAMNVLYTGFKLGQGSDPV